MRRIRVDSYGNITNTKPNHYHRDNGPAYISYNHYYQSWLINGKYHRLDGPAFIRGNYQVWYIDDIIYTKDEYDLKIKKIS